MLLKGARILMIHRLGPSSLYSLDLYLQTELSAVDEQSVTSQRSQATCKQLIQHYDPVVCCTPVLMAVLL